MTAPVSDLVGARVPSLSGLQGLQGVEGLSRVESLPRVESVSSAAGLLGSPDLPGLRVELMGPLLLVGVLVATLVIVWPPRRRWAAASAALGASGLGGRRGRSARAGGGVPGGLTSSSVWRQDPVVLYRSWRLRHDPDVLLEGVLELLDAMAPALALGLTPTRALSLAIASASPPTNADAGVPRSVVEPSLPTRAHGARLANGQPRAASGRASHRRGRQGVTDVDRLVGSLRAAADRGVGLADVWTEWARLTRSSDLAFVASAWSLSEHHGAPLAVAVDRAAAGLREARARRRRVATAVAGPRATVTVLTLLPLAGPAFGLACGIDPATLYLGSPLATAGAVVGLGLILLGRLWCRAMIRRAVAP